MLRELVVLLTSIVLLNAEGVPQYCASKIVLADGMPYCNAIGFTMPDRFAKGL